MPKRNTQLIPGLLYALTLLSGVATHALAEEVPLVDGSLWGESSTAIKKAYLIGASNFIVAEYGYQTQSAKPPTDDQSVVPAIYHNIEKLTLDQAIARIDQWYKDHPGKLDQPVLSVIWADMVEPNL